MPTLSNARHERFAQGLAAGKTAEQAYVDAGYKPSRPNASHLTTNNNIKTRVAELQERAATNVVLSREWVLERLVANANRAMQAEQAVSASGETSGEYRYEGSVANRALELLGKELGMFVDRSENKTDGTLRVLSAEPLSQIQWEKKYGGQTTPTEH